MELSSTIAVLMNVVNESPAHSHKSRCPACGCSPAAAAPAREQVALVHFSPSTYTPISISDR